MALSAQMLTAPRPWWAWAKTDPFRYFNGSSEIVRLVVMTCAVLTDRLRDAHLWLDELTSSPNLNIESVTARQGNGLCKQCDGG